MEGPGSGVLIDACLARVPTTALMSSAAKVVLCKPITCKWCQDLPLCLPTSAPLLSTGFPAGRVWWERVAVFDIIGLGQSPVPGD